MPHTKGHWHEGAGNGEGFIFADDGRMRMEQGGTTLYPICKVTAGWDEEEDRANGRLLAAAPRLLAACRYALAHCNPTPGREREWDELIDGALAAATGR